MLSIFKHLLPVTAAFGLVLGIAATASRAEEGKDAPAGGKGSITGTVTDKDGKAVEGVKVNLMKPRQKQGGGGSGGAAPAAPKATHGHHDAIGLQQRPQPIATATTDKDGKYEMKDVDAGDYGVIVRDDDKKVYGRAKVKVEDGKAATADIKCTDTPPQRGGGGGGGGNGGGAGGGAAK